MNHECVAIRGSLSFTLEYDIDGVEDRDFPYSSVGAKYRPSKLTFTLVSESLEVWRYPRYKDLRVGSLRIGGQRVKKDGTTSAIGVGEKFYSLDVTVPGWVTPIVEEAVAQIREGRGRA
jgi:hypothetical protein